MGSLGNVCFASVVAFFLVVPPASPASNSAPSAPLGIVIEASNSRTGVDTTYQGATVYDGDRLATQDDGTMRLRLEAGQMFLHKLTSVKVHAFPGGFSADLDNGMVSVSSPEGHTFQVLVNGVTIRPASAHATSAQIAMMTPTEAILTPTRGDLLVSLDDEVKTVSAGNSYRLVLDSGEDASGSGPQAPVAAGRHRPVLLILIIGAVATGTGIAIWRAVVSPDAPSH